MDNNDNKGLIVDRFTDYHERMFKYAKEKKYDSKIIDLYHNGKFIFDNKEYNIYDFMIDYDYVDNKLISHLNCTKEDYSDILLKNKEKYNLKYTIQFRDTTAFINTINTDASKVDYSKKTIEIVNKDKLLDFINHWDGMVHSMVPETDAMDDKCVIGKFIK